MITEIIIGGLISHLQPQPSSIAQIQYRPNIIVKHNEYNLLLGHNSIGENIVGLGYDIPLDYNNSPESIKSQNLDYFNSLKLKLGAYYQHSKRFHDYNTEHRFGDIVPILGLEHKIKIDNNTSFVNILTPMLIFSGLALTF